MVSDATVALEPDGVYSILCLRRGEPVETLKLVQQTLMGEGLYVHVFLGLSCRLLIPVNSDGTDRILGVRLGELVKFL